MKNYMFRIFAILLTFGVFVTSCDVNLTDPEVDSETTEDNALGERAVGDVFGMVNTGTGKAAALACGDFNYDLANKTLVITFPTEGCLGDDGVTRAGVIMAQYTGFWGEAGSSVQITFVNYTRDGVALSGTIVVDYVSVGTTPVFNLTATNMSLTFTDGTTTWESSNTYTWVEGATTPLVKTDDAYSITGTTSGTARNGKEFRRVATNLVTAPDCKWFTSGNLVLTITDGDKTDVYDMTFKTPCGTVTIVYNGISITRTFQ